MRRADIVGGAFLLAFSLLMLGVIIPAEVEDGQWYGLSPYTYPNIICGAMAVFSLALLAQGIFKKSLYEEQQTTLTLFQLSIFILLIAVILAGVWLISVAGIWIGGPLMIISIALIMGEKRPLVLAICGLAPVASIYVLAIYVLKTPLP